MPSATATLKLPQKFDDLTADQQLRLCTAIMDNEETGWEYERKFKNPENLIRYFCKINANPVELMKRYQCFVL